MTDPQKIESLLVADIGSVTTKVGFIDRVGGDFRFVCTGTSMTTTELPTRDIAVGVRRAIEQIEAHTHRRFLTDDKQLITPDRGTGQGVDAFVALTSAPEPLRVAIVGLSRELSVASATRAVAGTYATIETILALNETSGTVTSVMPGGKPGATPLAQDPATIAAGILAKAQPDVIVLVGGIDGGATTPLYELANLVGAIVGAREESARPLVIFAGNRDARSQVAARLGSVAIFRVVDNIRPTLDSENLMPLERELEAYYNEKKITWLPGLNTLLNWTPVSVMPSARAFENVVRFLSRRFGLRVFGADLGGVSTTLVSAHNGAFTRTVRSDLGLGRSLENVVTQSNLARLMEWLPMEMEPVTARAHWLNHSLHPATIPSTRDETYLMQAAARVALNKAVRESALPTDQVDLILLSGGVLAHNSNLGSLALVALDGLQPQGVFTLAVDSLGLASAFGALASVNPDAAASLIERDAFVTLGTVIAPMSNMREGQVDLHVQAKLADGTPIDLEVEHGSLEMVPVPQGQKASIEIRLSRGVELPGVQRGVYKADVEGGALGLIIDARGRPITMPSDIAKCRTKVQKWYWDIGSGASNNG
jgi:hypothetical protein